MFLISDSNTFLMFAGQCALYTNCFTILNNIIHNMNNHEFITQYIEVPMLYIISIITSLKLYIYIIHIYYVYHIYYIHNVYHILLYI